MLSRWRAATAAAAAAHHHHRHIHPHSLPSCASSTRCRASVLPPPATAAIKRVQHHAQRGGTRTLPFYRKANLRHFIHYMPLDATHRAASATALPDSLFAKMHPHTRQAAFGVRIDVASHAYTHEPVCTTLLPSLEYMVEGLVGLHRRSPRDTSPVAFFTPHASQHHMLLPAMDPSVLSHAAPSPSASRPWRQWLPHLLRLSSLNPADARAMLREELLYQLSRGRRVDIDVVLYLVEAYLARALAATHLDDLAALQACLDGLDLLHRMGFVPQRLTFLSRMVARCLSTLSASSHPSVVHRALWRVYTTACTRWSLRHNVASAAHLGCAHLRAGHLRLSLDTLCRTYAISPRTLAGSPHLASLVLACLHIQRPDLAVTAWCAPALAVLRRHHLATAPSATPATAARVGLRLPEPLLNTMLHALCEPGATGVSHRTLACMMAREWMAARRRPHPEMTPHAWPAMTMVTYTILTKLLELAGPEQWSDTVSGHSVHPSALTLAELSECMAQQHITDGFLNAFRLWLLRCGRIDACQNLRRLHDAWPTRYPITVHTHVADASGYAQMGQVLRTWRVVRWINAMVARHAGQDEARVEGWRRAGRRMVMLSVVQASSGRARTHRVRETQEVPAEAGSGWPLRELVRWLQTPKT